MRTVWAVITTHTEKGEGDLRITRVRVALYRRRVPRYGFWGI